MSIVKTFGKTVKWDGEVRDILFGGEEPAAVVFTEHSLTRCRQRMVVMDQVATILTEEDLLFQLQQKELERAAKEGLDFIYY